MRVMSCCCGCTLKTGCLIIGSLQVTLCTIGVLCYGSGIGALEYINAVWQRVCEVEENPPHTLFCNTPWHFIANKTVPFMIAATVGMLVELVSGSLLIHGARKQKPALLLAWLVIRGLLLVSILVWNICSVFLVFQSEISILIMVASLIITYALYGYFAVVVNSHRRELLQENYKIMREETNIKA